MIIISKGKETQPIKTAPTMAASLPKKPPARMAGIGIKINIPIKNSEAKVGKKPILHN